MISSRTRSEASTTRAYRGNKAAAVVMSAGFAIFATLATPTNSFAQPANGGPGVDSAFSPDGGAEELVLRSIASARKQIRLAAYSFTSAPVVRGLVDARGRGVDVAVLVDYKNNLQEDRYGKGRAALNLLANAGIPVRTIASYPIHHDKYIVIDGVTTQTGSFNYSAAAAKYNSENVLVLWNEPQTAGRFLKHWTSRWNQGTDYRSAY